MPTHGMPIQRDREFLGAPSSWPFRVGSTMACAVKRPSFLNSDDPNGTVVFTDGQYGLVREPIHEFLSGRVGTVEPITIEAILADDWIID